MSQSKRHNPPAVPDPYLAQQGWLFIVLRNLASSLNVESTAIGSFSFTGDALAVTITHRITAGEVAGHKYPKRLSVPRVHIWPLMVHCIDNSWVEAVMDALNWVEEQRAAVDGRDWDWNETDTTIPPEDDDDGNC